MLPDMLIGVSPELRGRIANAVLQTEHAADLPMTLNIILEGPLFTAYLGPEGSDEVRASLMDEAIPVEDRQQALMIWYAALALLTFIHLKSEGIQHHHEEALVNIICAGSVSVWHNVREREAGESQKKPSG